VKSDYEWKEAIANAKWKMSKLYDYVKYHEKALKYSDDRYKKAAHAYETHSKLFDKEMEDAKRLAFESFTKRDEAAALGLPQEKLDQDMLKAQWKEAVAEAEDRFGEYMQL